MIYISQALPSVPTTSRRPEVIALALGRRYVGCDFHAVDILLVRLMEMKIF